MLHVVCGAPCSGKTTYVSEHAGENALIIDADKIANALGGSAYHATGAPLKVALDARELAIQHALTSDGESWLIDTAPSPERLQQYADAKADVVVLDTPLDECLKRAKNRPDGTKEAIERWHHEVADDLLKNALIRRIEMNETVNQEANATAAEPERTFTQAEMDAIIRDRLDRERKKYADFDTYREKAEKFDAAEEAQKSELQKVTERADALQKQLDTMLRADSVRKVREKVAQETGVPVTLLSAEDEEACAAQAKAIMEFAKPGKYPNVPDAGEVHKASGGKTRDQFKDWFNSSIQNH